MRSSSSERASWRSSGLPRIESVRYQIGGQEYVLPAQQVWSTIPISILIRGMRPQAPADVLEAASSISYRGMILIYLVLDHDRFSPTWDACYFPEETIPISRMSEPKNFSGAIEPRGRTVLCAELPSDPGEAVWEMSDEDLGKRLCDWIGRAGLPRPEPVAKVVTRRLRQAYPFTAKTTRNTSRAWTDG